MHHLSCLVSVEAIRGRQSPWNWSYRSLRATMWSWELNPAPLGEEPGLLTAPHLWFSCLYLITGFEHLKLFFDYLHFPMIYIKQLFKNSLCHRRLVTFFLTVLFRSLSQRSSEMEYINKYRQLEAQEFDMYGMDQPPSGPGKQVPLNILCMMCG